MPFGVKFLCFLLVMIALGDVAHDVYVWHYGDGRPFAFAALGWVFKTYLPEEHQLLIDMLTPEVFNDVMTPMLAIPAAFLFLGLAALVAVIYFAIKLGKAATGDGAKDSSYKYKRH